MSNILTVQMQGEVPFLWAEVDLEVQTEKVKFIIRGTGHPYATETKQEYIGTFQMVGGGLIWHLYKLLWI